MSRRKSLLILCDRLDSVTEGSGTLFLKPARLVRRKVAVFEDGNKGLCSAEMLVRHIGNGSYTWKKMMRRSWMLRRDSWT